MLKSCKASYTCSAFSRKGHITCTFVAVFASKSRIAQTSISLVWKSWLTNRVVVAWRVPSTGVLKQESTILWLTYINIHLNYLRQGVLCIKTCFQARQNFTYLLNPNIEGEFTFFSCNSEISKVGENIMRFTKALPHFLVKKVTECNLPKHNTTDL